MREWFIAIGISVEPVAMLPQETGCIALAEKASGVLPAVARKSEIRHVRTDGHLARTQVLQF